MRHVPRKDYGAVVSKSQPSHLCERVNNVPDFLAQFGEESRKIIAASKVRGGWITLTMPYRNDDVHFHSIPVHIRRRTVTHHREDLCAIFHFPSVGDSSPTPTIGRMFACEAKIPMSHCAIHESEQSMFVRIVQFSQDLQKRRQLFVRSVVRLQRLENCPHRLANSSEPLGSDLLVKVRPVIRNRESQSSVMRWSGEPGLENRNTVDEIVQGGSQIVEAIGNHQSPSLEWRGLVLSKDEAITGAVSVYLLRDAVRVSVHPGLDFIVDGLSVFLTPGELSSNASEV